MDQFTSRSKSVRPALVLLSLLLAASTARAVDVTICGQHVPPGETGVLTSDLDCSATNGDSAVVLLHGATLDLQGHTLTGSPAEGLSDHGPYLPAATVYCDCAIKCHEAPNNYTICLGVPEPCTVTSTTGIGVIRGRHGIFSERSANVSNVLIQPAINGIHLWLAGTLEAENVSLEGGSGYGIDGDYGPHNRIGTMKVTLTNVSISGFGSRGVHAAKLRGSHLDVSDNGLTGITGGNVKVSDLVATGNGGLSTDCCGGGVVGHKTILVDSTVTGNTYDGLDIDLLSPQRPRLYNTACNHSAQVPEYGQPPSVDWDVCSGD